MVSLTTEILRDAKQTILYQRILIILLIVLVIGITLYKFPESKEMESNQVQYIKETSLSTIPPIKPAEYGRARIKKYRFGTV